MSVKTKKDLRNLFIYQVYNRNHNLTGTFNEFVLDLDRIKDLGVDVVYLLPIHKIGQKRKKGELGCPYSIQDYYSINPEYGTITDFENLISEIHKRGMKLMIDIVYNHTSHDSVLLKNHPKYFYRDETGELANKVGDWWDITDLDYTKDITLWGYLIDALLYWVQLGVDGFRWDVASLLPAGFLEEAEERVHDVNPSIIFLSESVHGGFVRYLRGLGHTALSESEIYQMFDMAYDYDTHPYFETYLQGKGTLKRYLEELQRQEEIYPDNYVKMRNLENHDFGRFAPMVKNDYKKIVNWTSLMFFSKGSTMMYAGQEYCDNNLPSLFDIDKVNWDGKDITNIVRKLSNITKDKIF
ncbi:MAG: alpha-amylase, partial [Candidatus Izimaplasma sp.]|nr:alpha-amylase [Candidatus Izimaplasma bacterium]